MKSYLKIVENVLKYGKNKSNRTGIDTIALPNQHFSHDMSNGFPLLTTKKMAFRSMCVELEGFLKGITSKRWYQDRSCKFWDFWANPQIVDRMIPFEATGLNPPLRALSKKEIQYKLDDLGSFYAHQLRRFGEAYDEYDNGPIEGYDQLAIIVDKLHNNPNDRRMVVSYWNPHQLYNTALPACHYTWCLTHIDGVLSLHWSQRSCDLLLGIPVNIAHYALLLTLLCKEGGFKPGNLSGMLCDCHIYENQIEGAKEQLTREVKQLPNINICNKSGNLKKQFSIFDWTHEDVELINYNPHPKIDFGGVAI